MRTFTVSKKIPISTNNPQKWSIQFLSCESSWESKKNSETCSIKFKTPSPKIRYTRSHYRLEGVEITSADAVISTHQNNGANCRIACGFSRETRRGFSARRTRAHSVTRPRATCTLYTPRGGAIASHAKVPSFSSRLKSRQKKYPHFMYDKLVSRFPYKNPPFHTVVLPKLRKLAFVKMLHHKRCNWQRNLFFLCFLLQSVHFNCTTHILVSITNDVGRLPNQVKIPARVSSWSTPIKRNSLMEGERSGKINFRIQRIQLGLPSTRWVMRKLVSGEKVKFWQTRKNTAGKERNNFTSLKSYRHWKR